MAAKTTWSPGRVTGVTSHALVGVRQLKIIPRRCSPGFSILQDRLGKRSLFIVIRITGRDAIHHLLYFPHKRLPIFISRYRSSLEQLSVFLEEPILPRREVPVINHSIAACRRAGQRFSRRRIRFFGNRAVTIYAIDLNCCSNFPVQLSIAVVVLFEVTINAVHALFFVNVLHVNRNAVSPGAVAYWFIDRSLEFFVGQFTDRIVLGIEKIAFSVVFENIAIYPTVSIEICKLSVFQLRIHVVADLLQEVEFAPLAPERRLFRVPQDCVSSLFRTELSFLLRIHLVAVCLEIPPHRTEIRVQHCCPGMHMTDDTLARRNRPGELVFDGMSGLTPRDGRISAGAFARVAEGSIRPGFERIAIIRVDYMASRTSTRSIISRLVVRSHERKHRVQKTCLLQSDVNGICPQIRPESSRTQ